MTLSLRHWRDAKDMPNKKHPLKSPIFVHSSIERNVPYFNRNFSSSFNRNCSRFQMLVSVVVKGSSDHGSVKVHLGFFIH